MGLHLRTSMKTRKKSKKDNNPIATLTCLKCQEKIHYLHSCPKEQSDTQMLLDRHEVENSSDEDHFTFFTVAVLWKQLNLSLNNWILLNIQPTNDVFCNAKLLNNIRESETLIQIHCNAGIMHTNFIGRIQWSMVSQEWHCKHTILAKSQKQTQGNLWQFKWESICGYKSDGSTRIFTQFYIDKQSTKKLVMLTHHLI